MPAQHARGLAAILARFPAAGPAVTFRVGLMVSDGVARPPIDPQPEAIFSLSFFEASHVEHVQAIVERLNAKYRAARVPEKVTFCAANGYGLPDTPTNRSLNREQIATIAEYGAAVADPLKGPSLPAGAQRLGEWWLSAKRFEEELLRGVASNTASDTTATATDDAAATHSLDFTRESPQRAIAHANAPPPAAQKPVTRENAEGHFSAAELAAKYEVGAEATRKALDRWRENHAGGDGYTENPDRRSNEPQFLYSLKAVVSVMDGLQSRAIRRTKTSGQRPAR
jgi:hypothetical protein